MHFDRVAVKESSDSVRLEPTRTRTVVLLSLNVTGNESNYRDNNQCERKHLDQLQISK